MATPGKEQKAKYGSDIYATSKSVGSVTYRQRVLLFQRIQVLIVKGFALSPFEQFFRVFYVEVFLA